MITIFFDQNVLIFVLSGFPRSGKSQGKMNFFQDQGKVREF